MPSMWAHSMCVAQVLTIRKGGNVMIVERGKFLRWYLMYRRRGWTTLAAFHGGRRVWDE